MAQEIQLRAFVQGKLKTANIWLHMRRKGFQIEHGAELFSVAPEPRG